MGQNKVNVEAWITYPIAKEIFTNAKLDLVELKQQALQ